MLVVIQRVSSASVSIGGVETARIGRGLLVLLGIGQADTADDGAWLAGKLARLRIFPNAAGKMDLSVTQIPAPGDPAGTGSVLVVSQFTLFAATAAGNRPSFTNAMAPDAARALYATFLAQCADALGTPVACGEFGADMQVALTNDGPVTILIDSRQRE
jgi:D-tyrosyl-tRNA(Tyr) deacylase